MNGKASAMQGVWTIALLGLLISCISSSWWLNAQTHYGYSLWYQLFDIEQHIHTYAPQNHYKAGFETLSAAEHIQAFEQISTAVHNHGYGLKALAYPYQGQEIPLLTRAEVIHLQDVANLIDILEWAALVIALFSAALLAMLLRWGGRPQAKAQLLGISVLVLGGVGLVLGLGAKRVFYQLHEWIFPAGHQWFFYYQESLMSTMMKAPDLFAGIAVAILVPGLALFALAAWLLLKLGKTRKL